MPWGFAKCPGQHFPPTGVVTIPKRWMIFRVEEAGVFKVANCFHKSVEVWKLEKEGGSVGSRPQTAGLVLPS